MVKKPKRNGPTPVRYKAARVDASVGSIAKRIEIDYKLPAGCVALVLPSGRRMRRDAKIRALLAKWD